MYLCKCFLDHTQIPKVSQQFPYSASFVSLRNLRPGCYGKPPGRGKEKMWISSTQIWPFFEWIYGKDWSRELSQTQLFKLVQFTQIYGFMWIYRQLCSWILKKWFGSFFKQTHWWSTSGSMGYLWSKTKPTVFEDMWWNWLWLKIEVHGSEDPFRAFFEIQVES